MRTHSNPLGAVPRTGRRFGTRISDRYSRRVGALKVILPGAGFGLLAVALLWPNIVPPASTGRLLPRIGADAVQRHEMAAPKFVGSDEKNRPFQVEAKSARLAHAKSDNVKLELPKASMTLESGNWVAVTAERGEFNQRTQLVTLDGDVNVFHDANYVFRTEHATIDSAARTAWGNKPISGTGPKGTIEAEGFRILDKGQTVLFTGKAKVVLFLDKQDMRDALGERKSDAPAAGTGAGAE
jgi:lipopolysaccharide export system protein LptC